MEYPYDSLFPEFNPILGWGFVVGLLTPALAHGANGVGTHAGFFDAVGDGVHFYPMV
jgi:hypothetical protein